MSMTTQEIMEILPHRHPFLLIDTVEEVEPGVRAVAKKNVTFNEPFFAGHFPGNPVMPGVLIVEALARPVRLRFFRSRNGKERRHILQESIKQNSSRKLFRGILWCLKPKLSR